jgi:hypothetical protein
MSVKSNEAPRTKAELLAENEGLRARLDEAEQTLDAIRSGDVDALVVSGPHGDQVFSLTSAERTYRLIVETMNEAALTVSLAGVGTPLVRSRVRREPPCQTRGRGHENGLDQSTLLDSHRRHDGRR